MKIKHPYSFFLFLLFLLYNNHGYSQQPIVTNDSIKIIKNDTIPLKNKGTLLSVKKDSLLIKNDSLTTLRLDSIKTNVKDSLSKNKKVLDSLLVKRKNDSIKKIQAEKLKKKNIDTIPFIRSGYLATKFSKQTISLKQGEIVSNVLKVVNLGIKPIEFATDVLYPAGWTRIDDPNKIYKVKYKDTIYVPIIISPTKLVNGNTEIIVNTFLIGKDQQQLANNYFSLKTKKKVSWTLNLNNRHDIYFKNDENSKRLDFTVTNTGNYKQDLFINYSIPKKDLFLSDTLENVIREPNRTFTLEADENKEFNFIITAKDLNKRNHKRISLNTYTPKKNNTRKSHSLIINSSEPRSAGNSLRKRTKINFIKLPNEIEDNKFGYPYMPITVELSAQNILDNRSFMSLSLNGFKQLTPNSNIIYSTQLNYSNSFYTNSVFKNAPWYVGYFDQKKSIEVGQVSGNLIGVSNAGKGIKGSYIFNEQHSAGAFYVNSNGFFDSRGSITLGGWYRYVHNNNFDVTARFGRNKNNISKRKISMFSIHPNINFLQKHFVSFTGAITNKSEENEPANFVSTGYLIGSTYSSNFYKKKLRVNTSFRYNDRHFSFGNFDRFSMNQRINYEFNNKWTSFLATNYQNLNSFLGASNTKLYKQELLFNNLVFSTQNESGSYQPGVYFEYRNLPLNKFHSRGITFRYSKYNFIKNFVTSFYTKAGYTKPLDNPSNDNDYFNLEVSSLARYKTWSFTARYNLGAFSALTTQSSSVNVATPQSLRLSLQNQHLFNNRHFAVESNAIYSFNNIFKNHTLGIFPIGYYFTDTGWRFGFSANYTFTTSDFSSVFDNVDVIENQNLRNIGPTTTNNFNLNFSIRKDFGIPIPFVDKTAANRTFVSFLDVNGNGKKDKNESTIQNVVVKLAKKEVLTNVDGKAIIKNILKGKYKFEVLSLEELNGWFPNTNDSIMVEKDGIEYIPFVRGVKVYGDVIVDRQKIAVADNKPLDLSRIKITASKGNKVYNTLTNKKGRFEFYLPFGSYIVTMDEGILNNRFRISRNNIPLELKNSQDGVYASFYIVEKRRKVIFKDFSKKKKN